jgi:hypothetical protein
MTKLSVRLLIKLRHHLANLYGDKTIQFSRFQNEYSHKKVTVPVLKKQHKNIISLYDFFLERDKKRKVFKGEFVFWKFV